MVLDRDENPECVIDTGSIKTMHDAKQGPPPCPEDAPGVTFCAVMIDAGDVSCKADFCPLCAQAHLCDHTCSFPCGQAPPAPPAGPVVVCDSDSSGDDSLCAAMIDGGGASCEADFCPTCDQAHNCDRTCLYPCEEAGGGHRLLDEESNGAMSALLATVRMPDCAWNTVDDRIEAVAVACCPEDGGQCAGGMPADCSYDCGKVRKTSRWPRSWANFSPF